MRQTLMLVDAPTENDKRLAAQMLEAIELLQQGVGSLYLNARMDGDRATEKVLARMLSDLGVLQELMASF